MSVNTSGSNGSNDAETNDITQAYSLKGDIEAVADKWEIELRETGGQIGANVSGSGGPTGDFNRGWHTGGSVEVSTTFTIPMDVPAWMIEQMKEQFDEQMGASVEIDMSTSVTGRPPKVKESGVVVPRGPSQERIDAMDEAEKTHTGKVTVTLDVTDQMQGAPDDLILEGSKVQHPYYGMCLVKQFSTGGELFAICMDPDETFGGNTVKVQEERCELEEQFPEETEPSAWWNDWK